MATNRIMVFGGGTVSGENGTIQLHPRSLERAERVIDYYHANEASFSDSGHENMPFILCTGGFGLLSAGVESLKANEREAVLMADHLVKKGRIPRKIILLEQESTSTLTNWTNSIELYADRLDPNKFSPSDRLGLVSHPHHLARVTYLAGKLGYLADVLEGIPTAQSDNEKYEEAVLDAYKKYLEDAETPSDMEEKERELSSNTALMDHLRSQQ